MDAEGTRLVIAGRDHAATFGGSANRKGRALQARIVALLDGGIKAVAVEVDDLAYLARI
jgi:hypothetical protein